MNCSTERVPYMPPTTWFEKLMHRIGYVPVSDLQAEWDNEARLIEIGEKKDDEINALSSALKEVTSNYNGMKAKAEAIHAAAVQKESELEAKIAAMQQEAVVARSEVAGDEYARNLFEDCFPGFPVPARLDEVMEKLHNFMTAQQRDVEDAKAKCLTFIDCAADIKEIASSLRGNPVFSTPEPVTDELREKIRDQILSHGQSLGFVSESVLEVDLKSELDAYLEWLQGSQKAIFPNSPDTALYLQRREDDFTTTVSVPVQYTQPTTTQGSHV